MLKSPTGPQIWEGEQRSEEWYRRRLGIPTASRFATILHASRRDEEEHRKRRRYMLDLAAEIITGVPTETYTNAHMDRGREMEERALREYAFATGRRVRRVGFVTNFGAGCSPDGIVGKKRVVEIKTTLPALLIEHHLKGEFPTQHMAQTQGQLWLTEREENDIAIFWPGLPIFIRTARRSEAYITMLAKAVALFNAELQEVVDNIRRIGAPDLPRRRKRRK